MIQPDGWDSPRRVLVILAHPDDPEFFCGGTLAKWCLAGHDVHYSLITCGDKGSDRQDLTQAELCQIRHDEQHAAAQIIGVRSVSFLDQPDGYIIPDLSLRRLIVREIRQIRPHVLLTCDPTNYFPRQNAINHPDHRAAGQVVLDALFPAAGNFRFFPELLDEGLQAYMPEELWISLPVHADIELDITPWWDIKLRALLEHGSQIGDPQQFLERMRSRRTEDSSDENPRYVERFRIIKFIK